MTFSGRELLIKIDMVLADDNLFKSLWWALIPGTVISVKWPRGWTDIDHLGNQFNSSDPNDHYRPWLEKNVGRQGWDWDWDWKVGNDCLAIKFRKGKREKMVEFVMRWA
jgi:hypothetical protein